MPNDNRISAEEIAEETCRVLKEFFKDKVGYFTIDNLTDTPYKMFNITFEMYNYYILIFSYSRGAIGCSIRTGGYSIDIKSSQQWYDKSDFTIFCEELAEDLESRIPDKFLQRKGWLK